MYTVELVVVVCRPDGYCTVARKLRLPYPPFPGLVLHGVSRYGEETVQTAAYDAEREETLCLLEDDQIDEGSLAEALEWYPGWERQEAEEV